MSGCPSSIRFALAGFASLCLGCGLADLFRPTGPEGVVLTYQGPTELNEGDTVAFTIVVRANGVVLQNPYLEFSIANPPGREVLALTARGDSLVGVLNGQARLTALYRNSLLTGSQPTVEQAIQVRQGPIQ